jgi:hypothetical protein
MLTIKPTCLGPGAFAYLEEDSDRFPDRRRGASPEGECPEANTLFGPTTALLPRLKPTSSTVHMSHKRASVFPKWVCRTPISIALLGLARMVKPPTPCELRGRRATSLSQATTVGIGRQQEARKRREGLHVQGSVSGARAGDLTRVPEEEIGSTSGQCLARGKKKRFDAPR